MEASSIARAVYDGSNGGATRSYCTRMEQKGQLGRIAAQLFRVQKASSRAKVYRGGIQCCNGRRDSYRDLAYQRKNECIAKMCDVLDADSCGLIWGWGVDPKQSRATYVLYVDLPQGQVSFHATRKYVGPDYTGKWGGSRESESRIITFCDGVMNIEGR